MALPFSRRASVPNWHQIVASRLEYGVPLVRVSSNPYRSVLMLSLESPRGLSAAGVGPRLVLLLLPLVGAAVAASWAWPDVARFPGRVNAPFVAAGVAWLCCGLVFWAVSVARFVRGFRQGELVTVGTFGLCRNPIYASALVFVLPALGLVFETWTLVVAAIVGSAVAIPLVRREERALAGLFGPAWQEYAGTRGALLPLPRRGWRRRLAWVGWAAVALFFLYTGALRPVMLGWGATADEARQVLPGDDLVQAPEYRSTRGITIDVPPDKVWPWVAQLGWGRGGLYSYQWLENLLGCRMTNADRIVAEWQTPRAGDPFRMDPRIPPLKLAVVDPPRAFVVFAGSPGRPSPNAAMPTVVWQFVVAPAGQGRSRLVIRWQSALPPGFLMELFNKTLLEPIHFLMEERMMRGIKARAEGRL
jgi:protein-S-isoprenylcysteine O-methyltransferase Ste14